MFVCLSTKVNKLLKPFLNNKIQVTVKDFLTELIDFLILINYIGGIKCKEVG